MSNNSSTGGPLLPLSIGGAVDDDAFSAVVQGLVVGVTGLSGNLVRPRWQIQPPVTPGLTVDWCFVGREFTRGDADAFTQHTPADGDTPGFDTAYRSQVVKVLASFRGPHREAKATLLTMGLSVDQNREVLKSLNINLVSCSDYRSGADLINNQWVETADVEFELRRWLAFTYPIFDLASATATIGVQGAGSDVVSIQVNAPPE